MIRVLVADDHALVRDGLRMILDAQGDIEVVAEVADGRAAVEQARRHRPDVVLMDIAMPRMDGIEATGLLRDGPRVLVLTTFGEDEHVYAALQAGACGFLLKDSPRARLLTAVQVIAAGEEIRRPDHRLASAVDGAHRAGARRHDPHRSRAQQR